MQAIPTSGGRIVRRVVIDRSAVPQVDDRRVVAARFERRGDVLEAERLDPEERTEAEAIVAGNRTQQQDVHARSREAIIRSR